MVPKVNTVNLLTSLSGIDIGVTLYHFAFIHLKQACTTYDFPTQKQPSHHITGAQLILNQEDPGFSSLASLNRKGCLSEATDSQSVFS